MTQPYKHPKTGMFYIRRKVPDALRAALGREFKRSLKTRDPNEAKLRFVAAYADSERAFTAARKLADGVPVIDGALARPIVVGGSWMSSGA